MYFENFEILKVFDWNFSHTYPEMRVVLSFIFSLPFTTSNLSARPALPKCNALTSILSTLEVKIFKKLQELKNAVNLCRSRSPQRKETTRSFHFWSFNTNKWIVDPYNWSKGLSLVQPDEKARIARFILEVEQKVILWLNRPSMHSIDSCRRFYVFVLQRALIGRLLIRASVVAHTKQPYNSLKLIRTRANKPILVSSVYVCPSRMRPCQFSLTYLFSQKH